LTALCFDCIVRAQGNTQESKQMYAEITKTAKGYWASIHLYAGGCRGAGAHPTKQAALLWIASTGVTDIHDCDTI